MPSFDAPSDLRTLGLRAVAAGLCVAGVAGVLALLAGHLGPADGRVIGTSFAFAVCSLAATCGGALRARAERRRRWLGTLAVLAAAVTFVLVAVVLWWPVTGVVVRSELVDLVVRATFLALIVTLWSGHASAVAAARRPTDGPAVRMAETVALGATALDAVGAALAVLEIVDPDHRTTTARLLAATLVVALFASALIPVLRRLGPSRRDGVPARSTGGPDARTRTANMALIAVAAGLVVGLALGRAQAPAPRTTTVVQREPVQPRPAGPPTVVRPAAAAVVAAPPAALREAEDRMTPLVQRRHPGAEVTVRCRTDAPPSVVCHVHTEAMSTAPMDIDVGLLYDAASGRVAHVAESAP